MPYQKCPLCGSVAHLNVSDPKSWYQHRYPELKYGSLVPGPCFACWQELKEGDEVEVRPGNPNTRPAHYGRKGRISEVVRSEEFGTIFLVRIGDRDEAFIRAELTKSREETA